MRNYRAGPRRRLVLKDTPHRKTLTFNPLSPLTVLGVVFFVLKVTGIVDWSWWWVTAPFAVFALLVVGVFALLAFLTVMERR